VVARTAIRGFVAVSILATASSAAFAADPAVPVIAKVRLTHSRTLPDGGEKILKEEEGIYYRSSKGVSYHGWAEVRAGAVQPVHLGHLADHSTGKSFDIQFPLRRAVLRHWSCPDWPPSPPGPEHILGEETVNGIECVILLTKCNGVECGRTWRSKELHFTVRSEGRAPRRGGATLNTVMEYYDIRIGEEPPAGEINFLERFEVMDNTIPPPDCPD